VPTCVKSTVSSDAVSLQKDFSRSARAGAPARGILDSASSEHEYNECLWWMTSLSNSGTASNDVGLIMFRTYVAWAVQLASSVISQHEGPSGNLRASALSGRIAWRCSLGMPLFAT
jgi:hypothetical protein